MKWLQSFFFFFFLWVNKSNGQKSTETWRFKCVRSISMRFNCQALPEYEKTMNKTFIFCSYGVRCVCVLQSLRRWLCVNCKWPKIAKDGVLHEANSIQNILCALFRVLQSGNKSESILVDCFQHSTHSIFTFHHIRNVHSFRSERRSDRIRRIGQTKFVELRRCSGSGKHKMRNRMQRRMLILCEFDQQTLFALWQFNVRDTAVIHTDTVRSKTLQSLLVKTLQTQVRIFWFFFFFFFFFLSFTWGHLHWSASQTDAKWRFEWGNDICNPPFWTENTADPTLLDFKEQIKRKQEFAILNSHFLREKPRSKRKTSTKTPHQKNTEFDWLAHKRQRTNLLYYILRICKQGFFLQPVFWKSTVSFLLWYFALVHWRTANQQKFAKKDVWKSVWCKASSCRRNGERMESKAAQWRTHCGTRNSKSGTLRRKRQKGDQKIGQMGRNGLCKNARNSEEKEEEILFFYFFYFFIFFSLTFSVHFSRNLFIRKRRKSECTKQRRLWIRWLFSFLSNWPLCEWQRLSLHRQKQWKPWINSSAFQCWQQGWLISKFVAINVILFDDIFSNL